MTKINREDFLKALETASPGLTPKAIIDQGDCFVFGGGRVQTFNDEVACSVPVPALPDLEGAVKAAPLLELLNKLSEETVEVTADGGEIIVAGRRRKAGFALDANVVLPLSQVEIPRKGAWQLLPDEFCEAIQVVQQCASEDENTFKLTCVHLHPDYMEASDDYQLCHWDMKTGVNKPTLVRKKAVAHVASLGMNRFAETESWFHFKNPTHARLSCRRFEEEFPDMSGWLKVPKGTAKLVIPKGLGEAAEKAAIFSDQKEDSVVLVHLKPGWLRLRGQGVDGWYEEKKKVESYQGPEMAFAIPPKLLVDLVGRHNECSVLPERLVVKTGSYKYASLLTEPQTETAKVEVAANGEEGGEG